MLGHGGQVLALLDELEMVVCANLGLETETVERGPVTQFAECGPGNVLGGLIRRISKATPTTGLSTLKGLDSLAA